MRHRGVLVAFAPFATLAACSDHDGGVIAGSDASSGDGSTFGGSDALGNVGTNGGALSSIGVSWTVINSLFSYNQAIGNGANLRRRARPAAAAEARFTTTATPSH